LISKVRTVVWGARYQLELPSAGLVLSQEHHDGLIIAWMRISPGEYVSRYPWGPAVVAVQQRVVDRDVISVKLSMIREIPGSKQDWNRTDISEQSKAAVLAWVEVETGKELFGQLIL
jgi:hypothetical protein